MFKIYTDQDKVPLFKGMKCYFQVPFIGAFHEKQDFYYIVKQDKYGNYLLCQHDKEFFSSMSGGCDYGENSQIDRYQADEYFFETKDEFLNALKQCNFAESDIKDALKKLKKLKVDS